MIDLLDLTVSAHGRLDRYNQFKTVSAHLGLGGRMWVLKGQEEVMKDPRVRVTVDLHREYASLAPFKLPNQHTAFTPDRVAVETTEGAIIDHRINPRAAFGGHTRETPWDNLHFTGARPPPQRYPGLLARLIAGEAPQDYPCHLTGRQTKLNGGQSMKAQSQPAPQQPSGVPAPKTTEVMVILTAKQGVTRQQIMNVMPAEIRATVKLYLDGKIRQWYSRGDGRGVIFVLDAKTVDEAHAIMDTLPLTKENLMDHEYIPVGPLLPLTMLIGDGPGRQ